MWRTRFTFSSFQISTLVKLTYFLRALYFLSQNNFNANSLLKVFFRFFSGYLNFCKYCNLEMKTKFTTAFSTSFNWLSQLFKFSCHFPPEKSQKKFSMAYNCLRHAMQITKLSRLHTKIIVYKTETSAKIGCIIIHATFQGVCIFLSHFFIKEALTAALHQRNLTSFPSVSGYTGACEERSQFTVFTFHIFYYAHKNSTVSRMQKQIFPS